MAKLIDPNMPTEFHEPPRGTQEVFTEPEPVRLSPRVVHKLHPWFLPTLIVLATISAFAFTYTRIAILETRVAVLTEDLSSTTDALVASRNALHQDISELRSETVGISQTLTSTKEDVAIANNNITAVQGQVGGVQETIGSISGTVSTLQKLSTIDPELLKKYSKVYFLNENYTPAHLTVIPQDYVYSNKTQEEFLTEAEPFLLKMLDAAKSDNVTIYVDSAYRSFAKQQTLKSKYSMLYGAGTANSFSADQGYSEHQLGTAVDLIIPGIQGQLTDAFGDTPAFHWLTDNAYKYGFELSYSATNTYYVYEPWHWRFVGVKLATALHDQHENFYDKDQRDIDTYLADLFDGLTQ